MEGEVLRVMKNINLYHGDFPVDEIRFDASSWEYHIFGGEIIVRKKGK